MTEFNASGWLLGVPTAELTLGDPDSMEGFSWSVDQPDVLITSAAFDKFRRVFRPIDFQGITISATALSLAMVEKLESLRRRRDQALSFIPFGARHVWGDRILSDDGTHLTLPKEPATKLGTDYRTVLGGGHDQDIITGFQVYTVYDPNVGGTGTEYYAGGAGGGPGPAYSALTRQLSLHTTVGGAGVACFVNWTYSGWEVFIRTMKVTPLAGAPGYYNVQLGLVAT